MKKEIGVALLAMTLGRVRIRRLQRSRWLPVTIPFPVSRLVAFNCGTFVVSTFNVTFPLVPPPVKSVPAVSPVIVPAPVPGNVCPAANVIAH